MHMSDSGSPSPKTQLIELRLWRQFLAVAEELHFGRAALRLHMTQPPLTQAIAHVEALLGLRLFDRTKRSVQLTPAGAALVPEARDLLARALALPAYARAKPYGREPIGPLLPRQITDVTQYLLQTRGMAKDGAAAERGKALFKGSGACWDCHGPDGGGDSAIGAPNLLDDVWLYGDASAGSIAASIANGRAGKSPAFARKLDPIQILSIAVYVASLSRHAGKDIHHD